MTAEQNRDQAIELARIRQQRSMNGLYDQARSYTEQLRVQALGELGQGVSGGFELNRKATMNREAQAMGQNIAADYSDEEKIIQEHYKQQVDAERRAQDERDKAHRAANWKLGAMAVGALAAAPFTGGASLGGVLSTLSAGASVGQAVGSGISAAQGDSYLQAGDVMEGLTGLASLQQQYHLRNPAQYVQPVTSDMTQGMNRPQQLQNYISGYEQQQKQNYSQYGRW